MSVVGAQERVILRTISNQQEWKGGVVWTLYFRVRNVWSAVIGKLAARYILGCADFKGNWLTGRWRWGLALIGRPGLLDVP